MAKGLTDEELKTLVQNEMRQSLGYSSSKLSQARQKAEYYYLGLAVGDLSPPEVEGRSSVVSTDVRDTIEAMLPQLMVTFCGGDSVVEFQAQNPDDEDIATQATEYINYLFFKKNNGHKITYNWLKDALLQKNGIVKVWWDTRFEETKEEYKNLSDVELSQIMDDDEIEIIAQSAKPDEEDEEQRKSAIDQLTQQLKQSTQAPDPTLIQAEKEGNPRAKQQLQQMMQQQQQASAPIQQQIQQIKSQPKVMVYDITCKRVKTDGKIQIDNVPPEEFLIARNAKDIQTAKFVGHRVQRTVSELKSMGYKNVDDISGEDQGQAVNSERIQRLSYNDENAYMSDDDTKGDESQRRIWVTECYVRCDFNGSGISELRKVTIAGNEMLDNEEVDFIPFVSITPVPLPHTFFGLSIADLGMESQKTKTSILRSQLDNMYLSVNGRYFAVNGKVNLDDLLTSRPGGVVRMDAPGMAGRLDQGMGNSGEAMQLMEYMQQDLENKTGWSRQSMGNSASGINTTATAANIVTNKADMRIDLIARNFAEGFTELFKYVLKLVCQHQDKETIVKLTGGWVPIDPREWRNQFDVSINVGIGLGSKDQKMQHLMALINQQEKVMPLGIANGQNIFSSSEEMAKLLGFKNGDKFFTDPSKAPPQQPKPDPETVKIQGQMQIEQMKQQSQGQYKQAELQANAQIQQNQLQLDAQLDQAKREHEMQLSQVQMQYQSQVDNNRQQAEANQKTQEIQQQAELQQMKASYDIEHKSKEMEFNQWKAQLDNDTKILIAQISANKGAVETSPETDSALQQALSGFTEAIMHLNKPKTVVRGPDGKVIGIE